MSEQQEQSAHEKLATRVEKLERQRWEKWAQSATVPIVLLLLGAWVNGTLQKGTKHWRSRA